MSKHLVLSTFLAVLVGSHAAEAQSFGINFRSGTTFTVNSGSGLVYSNVPANQWHNSSGNASATDEAVTSPAAPGVTVSYSSANTYFTNVSNDIGDGYLDDTSPGLTVTVKGLAGFLPPGQLYRVRALQSSDNATGFAPITIYQGPDITGTVLGTLVNPVTGSGALFGESAYSTGLSADVITFKPSARSGSIRATLSGLVFDMVPPPADHFFNAGTPTYPSAPLGNGLVSTFRIGSAGSDKVTVSGANGLSVGTAPGNTHLIDITANGIISPGTYTLIDYEGTIGGAGFAGFSLRNTPHLMATLVDNAAETKVDLVIGEVDALNWTGANGTAWDTVTSNWSLDSTSGPAVFQAGDETIFADGPASGSVVISGGVSPAAITFVNENLDYLISGGPITGATGFEVFGTGSVKLQNENTFTGPVSVGGGTLIAAAEGSLGAPGKLDFLNSATLKVEAGVTKEGALSVTGGGTIEVDSGATLIHKGSLKFDGTLTKTGEGALRLESYAGSSAIASPDLVIDGGTVELASGFFNGLPLGGSAFQATVNSGAVLRMAVAHAMGGDYFDYGTSLGQITVAGGTLQIDGEQYLRKGLTGGKGNFVLHGGFIAGSSTIRGVTYDSVPAEGATYSTISSLASATTSEIYNSGGIETGYRSVVLDVEDGTAASDLLLDAPVSGTNGLIKTGPGTLTFTGSATNSGTVEIREGNFTLSGAASLGTVATLDVAATAALTLDFTGTKPVKSFKIGGVTKETGTWGRPGSAADYTSTLITGDGLLGVGLESPFASWIATNYPALTGTDAEATADPDDDGLDNFTEFAFDGNPASGAASGKIRGGVEGQALVITLPVRDGSDFEGLTEQVASIDGVTYTVGGSNGLAAFDQEVSEIAVSAANMPTLSTGWSYRTFRLAGDIATRGAKGFLRATVE